MRGGHGQSVALHHRHIFNPKTYPIFVIELTLQGKVKNKRGTTADGGGWPRWLNLRLKGSAGCTITRETRARCYENWTRSSGRNATNSNSLAFDRVRAEFRAAEIEAEGTSKGLAQATHGSTTTRDPWVTSAAWFISHQVLANSRRAGIISYKSCLIAFQWLSGEAETGVLESRPPGKLRPRRRPLARPFLPSFFSFSPSSNERISIYMGGRRKETTDKGFSKRRRRSSIFRPTSSLREEKERMISG